MQAYGAVAAANCEEAIRFVQCDIQEPQQAPDADAQRRGAAHSVPHQRRGTGTHGAFPKAEELIFHPDRQVQPNAGEFGRRQRGQIRLAQTQPFDQRMGINPGGLPAGQCLVHKDRGDAI